MTRTPWMCAGAAALLLVTGCSERETSPQGPSGTGAQQQARQQPGQEQPAPRQAPLAQQGELPAGALSITGQVTASQGGAIKVRSSAGESILMQLNEQTQVFVNGRQGGPGDLTEGAEVRAAFQPPSGAQLPTALRVDVTGRSELPED